MALDRSFEPVKLPVRYYRFGGRQHWMYVFVVVLRTITKFGVPLTAPACSGPHPPPLFQALMFYISSPPHNPPHSCQTQNPYRDGACNRGSNPRMEPAKSRDLFANFIGFTCDASHYFLFRSSGIIINQLCIPAGSSAVGWHGAFI